MIELKDEPTKELALCEPYARDLPSLEHTHHDFTCYRAHAQMPFDVHSQANLARMRG